MKWPSRVQGTNDDLLRDRFPPLPQHDDVGFDQALGMPPASRIGMVPVLPLLANNLSGEFRHGGLIVRDSFGVT